MSLDGGGRSEGLKGRNDVEVTVGERDDRRVFERWWKEERWVVEVSLRCEGGDDETSVSLDEASDAEKVPMGLTSADMTPSHPVKSRHF